ncbi:Apses transcription factor [Pyrenophora tritici-repentis]|nr:Apses transcription factor [Pyrenophora tritici-repentis]KAI1576693.1 transcription factor MBP1 [Pyrenophora tritici-repentis]PZC99155.1 KilA-N multi-domain protein [Pyrenophora tritici-repentis]PZD31849.1 KilA-N multi-domain protein [Pyrenophora tritici-repentis]PZD42090.1 KilA-N multi-domain protein [Pyrenophora tritici-repentis]
MRSAWDDGTCRPEAWQGRRERGLLNATSPGLTRNADTPSRNHLTRLPGQTPLAHRMVKMPPAPDGKIYSATYSNVPVYECNVNGNHVMRRRADDWINATHILKVADYDKPARTRILEREVQKGVHEKVQGGYGKYQGTWIPLEEGRHLAERNGVLDKMRAIFDYIPAAFAASQAQSQQSQVSEETYEASQIRSQIYREETPDNETVISESMLGDADMLDVSQYSTGGNRKRKRADQMSLLDQQHQIWADRLLDYFMLLDHEEAVSWPEPPASINLDRPIDEKGHAAMHWAAAMGDVGVVKELINRGARIDCLSNNLETPLMRAVMFTNNFDKETMPSMVKIFQQTVHRTDWFGSTVFHHIAATTSSSNKYVCARWYLDCIINKLSETWIPEEVTRLLNAADQNGDTAIMIAARNGARKCVRSLLGRNVVVDIPNKKGETADDLIRELNQRRRMHGRTRQASSSPFAPPPEHRLNGHAPHLDGGPLMPVPFPTMAVRESPQYRSQTASHLMNKVAPTLLEKCEELAAAYEAELQEKEAEAFDAERVVKRRQAELEAVRKQVAELQGIAIGLHIDLNDEEADRQQEQELRLLVEEAESLLEIEQKAELRRLCSSMPQQNSDASPVDATEKLKIALLLHRAQLERRELVREVVGNLSVAGMSEKQGTYKKLIAKALGEREEDVESMLPEILQELEEAETQERAEGLDGSPL